MSNLSKLLALVLVFAFLTSSMSATVKATSSGGWSMFRSDPAHSGIGTENSTANSLLTPTQLWKTNITFPSISLPSQWPQTIIPSKQRVLTEPSVVDGIVYVGANSRADYWQYDLGFWIDVYALNATNGAVIWDYRDNTCHTVTPPAVVNGTVYFATEHYTCALRASDGYLLWNFSAGTFVSYPTVVQNILFIGSGEGSEGTLLALNATSGQSIWNFTNIVNSRSFSTPAVTNGLVYVGSFDENMYALNMFTGQKIWSYPAGDFHPAPAVANKIVYGITSEANIYALDATQGTKIWNYSIYDGGDTAQQPYFAISNGVLYARNGLNKLYALNAVSGNKIWIRTFESSLYQGISAPTVVNSVVYLGSDTGIYALNANNGENVWNYSTDSSFGAPVVFNSVLYGTSNEQVYAIQIPSSTLEPNRESMLIENSSIVLAVTFLIVIAVISLLLYRRHRKPAMKHTILTETALSEKSTSNRTFA